MAGFTVSLRQSNYVFYLSDLKAQSTFFVEGWSNGHC